MASQAQAKVNELPGSKLEALSEITATPSSQLKFVSEAWTQVQLLSFLALPPFSSALRSLARTSLPVGKVV